MSEYAVERARQLFQSRRPKEAQRARSRRLADAEAPGGPDGDAGDLIGMLQLMHTRLRRLDGRLREEHQLNLTELHVLSMIPTVPPTRADGRGDPAARLAGDVELSPSGLTRLVDRLVARGLVARVDDAWDRRIRHMVLTERGRAVRDAVLPQAVERIRDSCGEDRVSLERLRWLAAVPGGR